MRSFWMCHNIDQLAAEPGGLLGQRQICPLGKQSWAHKPTFQKSELGFAELLASWLQWPAVLGSRA